MLMTIICFDSVGFVCNVEFCYGMNGWLMIGCGDNATIMYLLRLLDYPTSLIITNAMRFIYAFNRFNYFANIINKKKKQIKGDNIFVIFKPCNRRKTCNVL